MDTTDQALVLMIASLIGSIAFALSGFLVGTRKQLDVMGIFILAFLTANGGGVIRDVLLGQPPAILLNTQPFWLTAAVVLLASLLKWQHLAGLEKHWLFVVSDGIGLVAFGITGTLMGIEAEMHFFGVLTLALLTATGGGIIRDVLVNDVPEVLHGGFYGSIALLLSIGLYGLHLLQLLTPASILAAFIAGLAIRLIAYKKQWSLPKL